MSKTFAIGVTFVYYFLLSRETDQRRIGMKFLTRQFFIILINVNTIHATFRIRLLYYNVQLTFGILSTCNIYVPHAHSVPTNRRHLL